MIIVIAMISKRALWRNHSKKRKALWKQAAKVQAHSLELRVYGACVGNEKGMEEFGRKMQALLESPCQLP